MADRGGSVGHLAVTGSTQRVVREPVRCRPATFYLFVRTFIVWGILGSAIGLAGLVLYHLAR